MRFASRKVRGGLGMLAVASLALSGCVGGATGGGSNDTPSSGDQSGEAAVGKRLTDEEVAALGEVELTIASYAGGNGTEAFNRAAEAFMDKYPNVKISISFKAFNDYGRTIDLLLQSDEAPDIAQINAVMARRVTPGGLLKPLDDYAEAFGWADAYPASVLSFLTISDDGKVFGEGHQWGVAPGGNIVGVFYNTEKFDALGLEHPKDLGEFEETLKVAKEAGELPISLGNLEQYPALHVLSAVMNYTAGKQEVNAWINGLGSSFTDPGYVDALATFQRWAEEGYISSEVNGITIEDAVADFINGEGLYAVIGNWNTGRLDAMGDGVGFFPMPGPNGEDFTATSNPDGNIAITSHAENPDLAALFLDFYAGAEMAESNFIGGFLPYSPMDVSVAETPLQRKVLEAWYEVVEVDGLVGFADSATPSMGDTMFPAIQSLVGLQADPQQTADAIQENWDAFHAGN